MLLLGLYLIVLIVVIILFFYSHNEGFQNLTTSSTTITSNSLDLPTTSSSYDEMENIDINFTELEETEKYTRDEKSIELNECVGKYVNRKVKPFRDVSEIMFSKVEDCDNIFEATEVNKNRNYFEQMGYW